ncbi:MAG: universal stress protein [Marmoricola sp.]|nr:universal stress protein [Marmoricola sp.]
MHVAPGTIVVGTDGSETAATAVRFAATRAVAEHRPLTLLTALHPVIPAWLGTGGDGPVRAHERLLRARGHEILSGAHATVDQAFPGLEVHELFVLDDPREALTESSYDAHVVVVGSRGNGPLRSLLLGSTAVAVVRAARCPVVVHRATTRSPHRSGVAVGADGSQDSVPVLELAFGEADRRGVSLTVVHSTLVEDGVSLEESLGPTREKYPDVETTTVLGGRMPEECLLDLGDQVDLLVVGVHHQGRASQLLFGSVSSWLVEHATCPVAVVPIGIP